MPLKNSSKGKAPKGKGPAVNFASQKLVRPPYDLLVGEIFKVPGSWWGSQITGAARTEMNVIQCMSVNEHWRPGGTLSAPKIGFKVGMVMIDDPFFTRDLVEGTDYWWVELNKMSEAYLPHLEHISLFAHRAVLLGLVRRSIIKKINGKSRFCLFYCRSDLPTWGQVIGFCARPDRT